jgi:hypothetical protein
MRGRWLAQALEEHRSTFNLQMSHRGGSTTERLPAVTGDLMPNKYVSSMQPP